MTPEPQQLVEPNVEAGTPSPDHARTHCQELRATAGELENAIATNLLAAPQLIPILLQQACRTFDAVVWNSPPPADSLQGWEAQRALDASGAAELSLAGPAVSEDSSFLSLTLDASRVPRHMTLVSPGTPWQVVSIGSISGGGWIVEFTGTDRRCCVSPSGVPTTGREIETRLETALEGVEEAGARLSQRDVLQRESAVTSEPFDILCGRLLADSPEEIARWSGDNILPGLTQKMLAVLASVRSQPGPEIPECPECRRRTRPGARFCGGCGAKLAKSGSM